DGGMGPPGSAAGPHWNPMKAPHGYPTAKMHHPGDFGNFTVDPSGKGTAKISTNAFNLDDTGEMSAIGHALIIHGGTDDGAGENGDAGPRVGCGIIEKQQPRTARDLRRRHEPDDDRLRCRRAAAIG